MHLDSLKHGHIRVPISTTHISTLAAARSAPAQKNKNRVSNTSTPVLAKDDDDDDDFMPPLKHQACACDSSCMARANLRRTFGESATTKLPAVRCVPSIFNRISEHLNMHQRKEISELGFGGLLQLAVDGLYCTDLLVYLMDKLNPETMILEVGNEGGLRINELCVDKVFCLPTGHNDPPSSIEEENTRALAEFRKSVLVEQNKEVKCKHLLDLMRKLKLDSVVAVRIFFVVAFNKLLFPAVDNNIRGQDAFLTKDLSQFGRINWCKAVIHELRHAAITWQSEKKKSIPGCGLFLIIFYLDNLDSWNSIDHFVTPRAKFFDKSVMEKLILEDKRRDRFGNVTYGNLQPRNINKTCYRNAEPTRNGVSRASDSSSSPIFPGAEEIGVLLPSIASTPLSNMATDAMKRFHAKASHAINCIQSGSQMLVDAHNEFTHTMKCVSDEEANERRRDQDLRDTGPGIGESK